MENQETTADAIIGAPNLGLAYTTSFLLGFSDACFNTQVHDQNDDDDDDDDDVDDIEDDDDVD